MKKTIQRAKSIQSKSRVHEVRPVDEKIFEVTSGTSGLVYLVQVKDDGATCTCGWGRHRPDEDARSGCSHVVSAFNHVKHQDNRRVSVWNNESAAKRQKKQCQYIGDNVFLTSRLVRPPASNLIPQVH